MFHYFFIFLVILEIQRMCRDFKDTPCINIHYNKFRLISNKVFCGKKVTSCSLSRGFGSKSDVQNVCSEYAALETSECGVQCTVQSARAGETSTFVRIDHSMQLHL